MSRAKAGVVGSVKCSSGCSVGDKGTPVLAVSGHGKNRDMQATQESCQALQQCSLCQKSMLWVDATSSVDAPSVGSNPGIAHLRKLVAARNTDQHHQGSEQPTTPGQGQQRIDSSQHAPVGIAQPHGVAKFLDRTPRQDRRGCMLNRDGLDTQMSQHAGEPFDPSGADPAGAIIEQQGIPQAHDSSLCDTNERQQQDSCTNQRSARGQWLSATGLLGSRNRAR